ncbi:nicotianamine synthase family protein [Desulfobacula sp.]|uniref:nicotianamine synthase family protein n=1 Tax=Desulfobacula sp. TaxID=2593537 RepID=UPI0025BF11EE|nr:nicotianamine synthase family protein [Desulfobacula sp.]MBC2704392.1 nicotianamine synthase [Desulfobacula sp.]
MHDINFTHEHEIEKHDFLGCCLNCRQSLEIVKPLILGFSKDIKIYSIDALTALDPEELYQKFQIIDDLAHLNVGDGLAGMILDDPTIRHELPVIRSCYTTFFDIHERHLAKQLLNAKNPWVVFESFPLYPRYKTLIKNQMAKMNFSDDSVLAFIGCGPVPMTLILLSRLYKVRTIGIDIMPDSVSLARRVVACLGLEDYITIIQGDETRLRELEWDSILVAALAEPKIRIFKNLRTIIKKAGLRQEGNNSIPLIYRTYTGMRAVLYKPVQPDDINGFKIITEIPPTQRVNNTTIIARLIE